MAIIGVSIAGILYSHIIETVRILFILSIILAVISLSLQAILLLRRSPGKVSHNPHVNVRFVLLAGSEERV